MSQSTTLTTFASLQNDTSATTDLNNNFSAINTALTGCLSLLGQAPNQMQANLDMNSNRMINLPAPVSINEPLRLADATTLNGGGTVTVSQLPIGGTTGQVLTKNSATNFDVSWQTPAVNVTAGKQLSVTNTLTLSGTDSTTITFQGTDTYVGRATTDSFSNKTFNANVNGNIFQMFGNTINAITGTGAMVLGTTPTINNANLTGTVSGTPSLSGVNFIQFSNIAQINAFSLLGNTAGSTGNLAGFTIGSLTQKGSPAANDLVLIQDQSASGALKFCTVNTLASAGSVSSIAGNTGAFTLALGINNATNQIQLDPTFHQGYLGGFNLSNDGVTPNTVIDISKGVCCDDAQGYMMKMGAFTKSIGGTWVVGTGNGGLDTGTVAINTWYHVFIIARTDTGVVDGLISTSATSPTMPTNYTVKRRIGSIKTDGSAHILPFIQNGDEFYWAGAIPQDIALTNPGVAAITQTLASVPTGVVVKAQMNIRLGWVSTIPWPFFSPLAVTDQAPGTASSPYGQFFGNNLSSPAAFNYSVLTNTSAQVRLRCMGSDTNATVNAATLGWVDTRGRNA